MGATIQPRPAGAPRHSLLWRLFSTNAVVLILAGVALLLTPTTVSPTVRLGESAFVVLGLMLVLYVNLVVMRRVLTPLGDLCDAMRIVNPLRPGERVDVVAESREVSELAAAFNEMLDRIELERRDSARRAEAAQERERRWLSMELHDEIGQSLTALLLQLDVAARTATPEQRPLLDASVATVRDSLERVRVIVRRLRPDALDALGLSAALAHLCERMGDAGELEIRREFARELPTLSDDAQLVVYRVLQESLTNITRHARAQCVTVGLDAHHGGVRLRVVDDGVGAPMVLVEGSGIRGMRERALMIGGTLNIARARQGGTEVVLDVPASEVRS